MSFFCIISILPYIFRGFKTVDAFDTLHFYMINNIFKRLFIPRYNPEIKFRHVTAALLNTFK